MLRVEIDSVQGLVVNQYWGSEEGGAASIIEVDKLEFSQERGGEKYKSYEGEEVKELGKGNRVL